MQADHILNFSCMHVQWSMDHYKRTDTLCTMKEDDSAFQYSNLCYLGFEHILWNESDLNRMYIWDFILICFVKEIEICMRIRSLIWIVDHWVKLLCNFIYTLDNSYAGVHCTEILLSWTFVTNRLVKHACSFLADPVCSLLLESYEVFAQP